MAFTVGNGFAVNVRIIEGVACNQGALQFFAAISQSVWTFFSRSVRIKVELAPAIFRCVLISNSQVFFQLESALFVIVNKGRSAQSCETVYDEYPGFF